MAGKKMTKKSGKSKRGKKGDNRKLKQEEYFYSTSGPSDEECRAFDRRINWKSRIKGVFDLGFDSVHIYIRDRIIEGMSIKDMRQEANLTVDTLNGCIGRLEMIPAPSIDTLGRRTGLGYRQKNSVKYSITGKVYPSHPCSNPLCKNMTTNRFLCLECYEKNNDEIVY